MGANVRWRQGLFWSVCMLLGGCGQSVDTSGEGAATHVGAGYPGAVSADPERVGQLWARSCALCHIDGNGGAPVVGDVDAWRPRLAQGREVLLHRTLQGHNNMPPLGYCMACETADFETLIDLMTAGVEPVSGDATLSKQARPGKGGSDA